MQGIISALPEPIETKVFALWDEVEAAFGAKFARTALIPHFSWAVAMQDFDLEKLVPALDAYTRSLEPFEISVSKAKSFEGVFPTVYLSLKNLRRLRQVHRRIWKISLPYAFDSNLLYSPESWVPHITIIHKDLGGADLLGKAVNLLNNHRIDWPLVVDNLTILNQKQDMMATLEFSFKFGKGLVYSSPSS